MAHLSIAICTADRPALCADLLASLLATAPGTWSTEVLLVDNGADRNAGPASGVAQVITRFAARAAARGLPLERVVGPAHNIARARNLALGEARGELVLWLDDDQLVGPSFLSDLELAWRHRPPWSEGLRLKVDPGFDAPVPPWVQRFFTLPCGVEGELVRRQTFATNGLLVRRDALRAIAGPTADGPFDPWFGTRGAEDTELFLRASAAGVQLSSTLLARVTERIPRERANLRYMARAAFRIGFTDTVLDLREQPRRAIMRDLMVHLGL